MSTGRPRVVLVHGLGGTDRSMEPLARALTAHDVTAVAVTLPGHGTTADDLVGRSWDEWRRAVEQAVLELDDGTGVVVVGQSMGAGLALHVAAAGEARHSVRGVVAVNTPAPDPDAVDGIEWRMSRGHSTVEATLADGESGYHSLPLGAVLAMARGMLDIDLAAVDVPVVVVNGALDETVDPASGASLAAGLTGVPPADLRRELLPRTGHVATFGPDLDALVACVMGLVGPIVHHPPRA